MLGPAGELVELLDLSVDLFAQAPDERAALLCRELLGAFDLVAVAQHVAVGFVVHVLPRLIKSPYKTCRA